MGKLADALSERSKYDDAIIVGSEIRAALQELTTEVGELQDRLTKIWLETKFVSPRIGEIKRLADTASDKQEPEYSDGMKKLGYRSGSVTDADVQEQSDE